MSNPLSRRPSTLAADKFRASPRSLGINAEWRPVTYPRAEPLSSGRSSYGAGNVRGAAPKAPSTSAAVPGAKRVATSAASVASATRAERESVLVTSVVVAFAMIAMVIAALKVNGGKQQDRSRTAMAGTLSTVYEQQSAFRILNQRFATWPELKARGLRMPQEQRVVASNTSPSHWFMAVRDTNTGIVCSRTGELMDESPFERTPTCSNAGR
ncbi:hypothetical protein [Gemmatimonas sp.]|uniref:hypothetical protein n=1 Tax=Gemmatimonas sp. TaxID=1962908 RepID=UPI003F705CD3